MLRQLCERSSHQLAPPCLDVCPRVICGAARPPDRSSGPVTWIVRMFVWSRDQAGLSEETGRLCLCSLCSGSSLLHGGRGGAAAARLGHVLIARVIGGRKPSQLLFCCCHFGKSELFILPGFDVRPRRLTCGAQHTSQKLFSGRAEWSPWRSKPRDPSKKVFSEKKCSVFWDSGQMFPLWSQPCF